MTSLLRHVSALCVCVYIDIYIYLLRRRFARKCPPVVWFGLFYVIYFSKEDEEWKEFEQREVDYSGLRLQALQMR